MQAHRNTLFSLLVRYWIISYFLEGERFGTADSERDERPFSMPFPAWVAIVKKISAILLLQCNIDSMQEDPSELLGWPGHVGYVGHGRSKYRHLIDEYDTFAAPKDVRSTRLMANCGIGGSLKFGGGIDSSTGFYAALAWLCKCIDENVEFV